MITDNNDLGRFVNLIIQRIEKSTNRAGIPSCPSDGLIIRIYFFKWYNLLQLCPMFRLLCSCGPKQRSKGQISHGNGR